MHTLFKGSQLPAILKSALIRGKVHWNDESYLAHIIFCEMMKGNYTDDSVFAISTEMPHHGHQILYVNEKPQTVRISRKIWTFDKYIQEEDSLLNLNF